MKSIGLIPARQGSKRIPGKNLVMLGGKPLLQRAIESAQESGIFSEIIVSTDWPEAAALAYQLGASVLMRPPEISGDLSHDYEWVSHAMQGRKEDCFAILRPTNPFRTAETIRRAWSEFQEKQPCDSIRAVEKTRHHPAKCWLLDEDKMTSYEGGLTRVGPSFDIAFPDHDLPMQQLQDIYCQNGCLQIALTHVLAVHRNVTGLNVMPFYTQGWEGFDINEPEDLEYAEWLIERGKE